MRRCWAILTGAYPPAPGGVGDYTRVVARALADAGDEVHVFTTGADAVRDRQPVNVRTVPGGFAMAGLGALDDAIERLPAQREILLQYTPRAFSTSGPNFALSLWLLMRSRRERITVMFHEVMHPIRRDQPLRHNLLGGSHWLAAALLARAATRVLVSTPRWGEILSESCGAACPIEWAPVPSNLPACVDAGRVRATRAKIVESNQAMIGHFGTYGPLVAPLLEPLIIGVLRLDPRARVLLLGRGSRAFRYTVVAHHPPVGDRLVASDALDEHALAEHLASCDLLVQPYPDGVTTRRGSAMAGLALGVPIVTNAGELTEPIWSESGCVKLARDASPSSMMEAVRALLNDRDGRRALCARARGTYCERFAVEHTVGLLRKETAARAEPS